MAENIELPRLETSGSDKEKIVSYNKEILRSRVSHLLSISSLDAKVLQEGVNTLALEVLEVWVQDPSLLPDVRVGYRKTGEESDDILPFAKNVVEITLPFFVEQTNSGVKLSDKAPTASGRRPQPVAQPVILKSDFSMLTQEYSDKMLGSYATTSMFFGRFMNHAEVLDERPEDMVRRKMAEIKDIDEREKTQRSWDPSLKNEEVALLHTYKTPRVIDLITMLNHVGRNRLLHVAREKGNENRIRITLTSRNFESWTHVNLQTVKRENEELYHQLVELLKKTPFDTEFDPQEELED